MIEILSSPPWARQRLLSPAVYLDHWALRRFAGNSSLGERLTNAIRDRGGTLTLSWGNMAEFVAMDKETRAAGEAERFLDANWPRLYFFRLEPFEVSKREDQRRQRTLFEDPEADDDLMRIAAFNPTKEGVLIPSTAGIITTIARCKDELEESFTRLKQRTLEATTKRFDKMRADPTERAKMMNAPTQPHRTRATLAAAELLLRGMFRRGPGAIEPNDMIDLLHATVPIAYCDFVLLDKRWSKLADKAILEMREASVRSPLARVFSGSPGEVEVFLSELERVH